MQSLLSIMGTLAAVALGAVVATMIWHNPRITLTAGALPLFGGGWFVSGRLKRFAASCKEEALTRLADALGLSYDPDADAYGVARLQELALLPEFEQSNYQDQFTGSEQGCAFRLYEARMQVKRGSGNTEHWITVFNGQIILIDFPKPFVGTTVINRHSLFGARHPGLERIHLESGQFERSFECYGSDQVGARELVHPVFMERLNGLEAALGGKRLRCAFDGGKLMVIVEGGDLFDIVKVFRQIPDRDAVRRGVEGIDHLLKLIRVILAPPDNPYADDPASPAA